MNAEITDDPLKVNVAPYLSTISKNNLYANR